MERPSSCTETIVSGAYGEREIRPQQSLTWSWPENDKSACGQSEASAARTTENQYRGRRMHFPDGIENEGPCAGCEGSYYRKG
jgi:hypothetical protein